MTFFLPWASSPQATFRLPDLEGCFLCMLLENNTGRQKLPRWINIFLLFSFSHCINLLNGWCSPYRIFKWNNSGINNRGLHFVLFEHINVSIMITGSNYAMRINLKNKEQQNGVKTLFSRHTVSKFMFLFVSFPSCPLSVSALCLSLHFTNTRLLFSQFSYLFCDFPQAISLSTTTASPLPLSLSGWPSTSFISARSSVRPSSFFLGN